MADIPLTDLTTNTKDGTGVFDKLMESMNDHIREEYKKGRITGPDYAKVYLGGVQSTMQQAIQFILTKQEADKKAELLTEQVETEKLNSSLVAAQIAKIQAEISLMGKTEIKLDQEILVMEQEVLFSIAKVDQMRNQALLTEAQVAKTVKEVEIADYQALVMAQEVEFSKAKVNQMVYEAELTLARVELTNQQVQTEIAGTLVAARQADKLEQDILVAEQQVLNMVKEVELTGQKVLNMQAEVAVTTAQASLVGQQYLTEIQNTTLTTSKRVLTDQQVTNLVSEELKIDAEAALIVKQGLKTDQEVLVAQQQVLNMVQEVLKTIAETAMVTQSTANAVLQGGLITAQVGKTDQEKTLLEWKTYTEQAQVSEVYGISNTAVSGIVGKQKVLYERQADGFLRDAEQKLAKIMSDSWAVRFSQDPNAPANDATPSGLSNARVTAVIGDAITGVTGASPPA